MEWTQEELEAMTIEERHEIVQRFAKQYLVQSATMTNTSEFRKREGESMEDVIKRREDDKGNHHISCEIHEDDQTVVPEVFEAVPVKVRVVKHRIHIL